jgi:hypothetical protein
MVPETGVAAVREVRALRNAGFVVRAVQAQQVGEAVALLRNFAPHVTAHDWERILLGPGTRPPATIGFGLYVEDRLVGFLGTLTSARQIRGRVERICNLHSVFVQPRFAAGGSYLLLAAMADPEVTLTALTPSPRVRDVLIAAKFAPLEHTCRLHLPLPDVRRLPHGAATVQRVTGDEPWLEAAEATLLRDHAALGCRGYMVREGDRRTFVVTRASRLRRLPMLGVSDLLHVGDPELAAKHFGRLKLAIMIAERSVILRCDARLLDAGRWMALTRERPSYFRSFRLQPIDIDNLYSEMLYQDLLAASSSGDLA